MGIWVHPYAVLVHVGVNFGKTDCDMAEPEV